MIGPVALQAVGPLLGELSRFESTDSLERSNVYQKLKPKLESILNSVWQEEFVCTPSPASNAICAVAWNIERGMRIDPIIRLLQQHPSLHSARRPYAF